MMKRFLFLIIMLSVLGPLAVAQSSDNYPPDDTTVTIDSTNLPIVWIDVDGAMIERHERITARMKIIHNGKGQYNYGDTVSHPGQHIDYEGYVALRYRGNTSYTQSDKKPYSFRTLNAPLEEGGKKVRVSLLGMGKDNNWALLAPYSDKSMIRDLLAFEVARPWMEYTPQGRLCELYLDGIYYGVFILCEVVTQGSSRLNLPDPGEEGDDLTGGYVMEVANNDNVYYLSKHHPMNPDGTKYYDDYYIRFQYKFPDYEDLTETQKEYIHGAIDRMEDAFAAPNFKDPVEGYRKYIDLQSFMDYQLVNELGHNVDAYRLSAKFFKRRDSEDPRFKMVIWDFNLAFGNCRHNLGYSTSTWVSRSNTVLYSNGDPYMVPFWWTKMVMDNAYVVSRRARWAQWREANLREDRIMATVDSLVNEVTCCGAEARNSQAWPRWGVYVWPNKYISKNYADEIDHMKTWITTRIAWMDSKLRYTPPDPPEPPEPIYSVGDVNMDGEVTIADVTHLISIILEDVELDGVALSQADVDNDGEIGIADVTTLIDLILRS